MFWFVMALAFISGVSLTAVSQWFRPLNQGVVALGAGQFDRAREQLAIGEARFDKLPIARRLSPGASAASRSNYFLSLYEAGQHDAILEKAGAAEPDSPAHFWAGCVLFSRAVSEKNKEARIGLLTGASAEFRLAIAADPSSWDPKYDYELTERLLAQLRDPPRKPPKQQLQLLRPESRSGRPPSRPIG